jgi:hypothetical protein
MAVLDGFVPGLHVVMSLIPFWWFGTAILLRCSPGLNWPIPTWGRPSILGSTILVIVMLVGGPIITVLALPMMVLTLVGVIRWLRGIELPSSPTPTDPDTNEPEPPAQDSPPHPGTRWLLIGSTGLMLVGCLLFLGVQMLMNWNRTSTDHALQWAGTVSMRNEVQRVMKEQDFPAMRQLVEEVHHFDRIMTWSVAEALSRSSRETTANLQSLERALSRIEQEHAENPEFARLDGDAVHRMRKLIAQTRRQLRNGGE